MAYFQFMQDVLLMAGWMTSKILVFLDAVKPSGCCSAYKPGMVQRWAQIQGDVAKIIEAEIKLDFQAIFYNNVPAVTLLGR